MGWGLFKPRGAKPHDGSLWSRSGKIADAGGNWRSQNKTMKNTRGEREGGRQPPLANCRKCNYDLNRSVTHRASRQKRSAIGGHSSRPKDGQTSGNRTEGKPPFGLSATQSGCRKKSRGGATAACAGGLYPRRGGRRAPDNRSPRRGSMARPRDGRRRPTRPTGAKNPNCHDNRRATMKPHNDSARECSSSKHMKNTRAGSRGPARNSVR